MPTTIRPMTAADVGPATEAVLRGDWGDRRIFFTWAVGHAEAHPLVAEVDGEIVGTGVGTANGVAGWVGAVFVEPRHRGRGLGRALTDEIVRVLEAEDCSTLVLVATDAGRPLYERMGFRLDTTYHTIEAPGVDPAGAGATSILDAWSPGDLAAMADLDRAATGEDRQHLLRAFATVESVRVLRGRERLRAFVVRAPWGGGATVAPELDDGVAVIEARRALAGPGRIVRAGILAPRLPVMSRLRRLGWREAWSAPRLIRGEPLTWRPEAIWGQFNHALG